MKNVKTFIYVENNEYYLEKKITLVKNGIRFNEVKFDLNKSKGLRKFVQKLEIKREMKKLIENSEVIVFSNEADFSIGNVIITTNGIIVSDNISKSLTEKAVKKRDKRIKNISSYFMDGAYRKSFRREYDENFENMNEVLLSLYEILMTSNQDVSYDIYLKLLDCLIEAPQPIKSDMYEKNNELLGKEWAKRLVIEHKKNQSGECAN